MRTLPNVLIFSVFQKGVSVTQNDATHKQVLQALNDSGVPCIELTGRYNGVNEKSILVQGFEYRATVEKACKTFSQECYLESHNDRATSLVYPDGRRESIGILTAVSHDEAMNAIGFSYNPIAKQYYICK